MSEGMVISMKQSSSVGMGYWMVIVRDVLRDTVLAANTAEAEVMRVSVSIMFEIIKLF